MSDGARKKGGREGGGGEDPTRKGLFRRNWKAHGNGEEKVKGRRKEGL